MPGSRETATVKGSTAARILSSLGTATTAKMCRIIFFLMITFCWKIPELTGYLLLTRLRLEWR
jgi:hypothetical protein